MNDDGSRAPETVMPVGTSGDITQCTSMNRAGGTTPYLVMSIRIFGGTIEVQRKMNIVSIISNDSMCDCGCEGYHNNSRLR